MTDQKSPTDPAAVAALGRPQQEEDPSRVAPLTAGDDGQDLPQRGPTGEVTTAERTKPEGWALEIRLYHYHDGTSDNELAHYAGSFNEGAARQRYVTLDAVLRDGGRSPAALGTLEGLVNEEIEAHGGNDPESEYCWWCHRNVNGRGFLDKQPHMNNCWLVRMRAALAQLRGAR